MSTETTPKTHKFKAEVAQVLSLVINSLYSNKEVALRELVSNAADALDKLRFEGIKNADLQPAGYSAKIRLIPDEENRTLTLWDNGIGMSEKSLSSDLGTVARSGTREFAQKLKEAQESKDVQLIGQFGVGFYSGYLIADRIDVISRPAGSETAAKWSSAGEDSFTIEPAEREEIGTSVVLHLKEEQADFAKGWKLRELVRRYSDFISYPIELRVEDKPDADADADTEASTETKYKFEAINEASAVWTRAEKDIADEQYQEFYKHLTHDWEPPLAKTHFKVEGTQMFTGLLYLPKRPPFDLLSPDAKHGVRLYVKRVFIMDDCEELLPRWMRFVRGVIDSDDLPLNVSRELLQDSALVRTIRKQVIRRVLDMIAKVAKDDADGYSDFWSNFGAVLKEGLHFDASYSDKLAPLMRYQSSADQGMTSLADYVSRMPEGQQNIYYALGQTAQMLSASPHLEALKQRGFEVLYMTDGVDQWAVEGLSEFEGKKLVNAMQDDLSLENDKADEDKSDEDKAEEDKNNEDFASVIERCKVVLSEHVGEVKLSARLTDSPVCLVMAKGGMPAHIERMIRAQQGDLPTQKRILEINPSHPILQQLRDQVAQSPESTKATELIEMLYDQALIAEGSPLPDPARFAQRLSTLMQSAG